MHVLLRPEMCLHVQRMPRLQQGSEWLRLRLVQLLLFLILLVQLLLEFLQFLMLLQQCMLWCFLLLVLWRLTLLRLPW